MKKRILVVLPVAALMVVMLAFFIATAAIAQGQGEERRMVACDNAHAPFEQVPPQALRFCPRTT
jgi:hypothetical protein